MAEKIIKAIGKSVVCKNPSIAIAAALCPLIGASASVAGGISMGAAVTLTLVLTRVICALLRSLISEKIRFAVCAVIAAGIITLADMLMTLMIPSVRGALGIFLPLAAISCLILILAEDPALESGAADAAVGGLCVGVVFTCAAAVLSVLREVLGNGTFFGLRIFGNGASFLCTAAGGLLVLGVLLAAVRAVTSKNKKQKKEGDGDVGC